MVYIIHMGNTPYVKIGRTKRDDVAQRLASLQTSCPEKLSVYRLITEDGNGLEGKLHSRFAEARTDGGTEWFRLTESDLEWLSIDDIERLIVELDAEVMRRKKLARKAKRIRMQSERTEVPRIALMPEVSALFDIAELEHFRGGSHE